MSVDESWGTVHEVRGRLPRGQETGVSDRRQSRATTRPLPRGWEASGDTWAALAAAPRFARLPPRPALPAHRCVLRVFGLLLSVVTPDLQDTLLTSPPVPVSVVGSPCGKCFSGLWLRPLSLAPGGSSHVCPHVNCLFYIFSPLC